MWQIELIFFLILFVLISLFIWDLYHIIKGSVCKGFRPDWSWCASINQIPEDDAEPRAEPEDDAESRAEPEDELENQIFIKSEPLMD